ncbi:MAG: hypothetical protein AAF490_05885 [Chloroflexota bacterium]
MATFKAFDENAEVLGASLVITTKSFGDEVIPILEKHHIFPIDPDGWYKQQDWLNAFSELSEGNYMNLVAMGMKVPDFAVWPPSIKTVHEALASINVAYHMNHRNGEIGNYHYEKTGDQSGKMVCRNPYPSDFDYGIIYRTVAKFTDPDNSQFAVRVDGSQPSRKLGEDSCTYLISW